MISVHEHHFPMQELVVARYQRLEAHFEDDQRFRREQVPEDTFPKFLRNNLNDAVQYGRLPYRNGLRIGPALMPNQA
jgi:hypothetical protein